MAKLGGMIGSIIGGIGGSLIAPGVGTAMGASLGGQLGGAVDAHRAEDNAKYARTQGMFGGPRVRPLPPDMQQTPPTMIPVPTPQRFDPQSILSRSGDPAATQVS